MARPLRAPVCVAVFLAFAGGLLAAPKPKISIAIPPSVEPPPTTRPTWPPISKEALIPIYQAEFGALFHAELAEQYFQAHELIELYFESAKSADRKAIAKKIEAFELPPAVIGRLCRIRMFWPQLDGGGVYYVNEKTGVNPVRYFFGLPKNYDRSKPWPLVIKLPTADAFVTEPLPDANRVTEIYTKWVKEELAAHPDAVVVLPLLNLDEFWGPSYPGMNAVIQPMQHVAGRANIDPAKVYLIGHGMSGHAVWNLSLHYPTYFAAVNPMAGAASADWQRLRIVNLRNVLPVVWHDAEDQVLKVDTSRALVKALKLQKVDVDYDETKGIGHTPDDATVERAYAKLRNRTRDLYPKSVVLQSNRPDTMFNRTDWAQIYAPLNPGKDHRVSFRHGTGTMVYNEGSWRIEAKRDGNKIEVTTDNVDSFRLYLNDQMVDLTRAVTLIVNKRPRSEAIVKQSTEELLKDQLFMGRGWRYYTGIIDVEMGPRTPPTSRSATKPVP